MSMLDRLVDPLRDRIDSERRMLRARFMRLNRRERWMVSVAVVATILVLFYLLIWSPMTRAHDRRVSELRTQRDIAQQLEQAAARLTANPAARRSVPTSAGQSLLSVVDRAAKTGGLGAAPERLQPESDSEVRMWINDVEFSALLRWLDQLRERHGVAVSTMDLERGNEPGTVSARLALVRA